MVLGCVKKFLVRKSTVTHLPLNYLGYREQQSDGQCLGTTKSGGAVGHGVDEIVRRD